MHIPNNPREPYTGSYNRIRLDFTPEPPLSVEERSHETENYPTTLAYIHVYLDEIEATKEVISGYLFWILMGLLRGMAYLTIGGECSAKWYSDPWRFNLSGDPINNRVRITLHIPGRQVVMQDASVPLDQFAREVIRLGHEWKSYLDRFYHDEMTDIVKGGQNRHFCDRLDEAEKALRAYEKMIGRDGKH